MDNETHLLPPSMTSVMTTDESIPLRRYTWSNPSNTSSPSPEQQASKKLQQCPRETAMADIRDRLGHRHKSSTSREWSWELATWIIATMALVVIFVLLMEYRNKSLQV